MNERTKSMNKESRLVGMKRPHPPISTFPDLLLTRFYKYTQEATRSSGKRKRTPNGNISPRPPSSPVYGRPCWPFHLLGTRVRLGLWGVEPVLWPRGKEERRRRRGRLLSPHQTDGLWRAIDQRQISKRTMGACARNCSTPALRLLPWGRWEDSS